jgi:hypothetical protein
LLIVRAVVPEADRAAFDAWYRAEHLPDAMRAFGVARAFRAWNRTTPEIHVAAYEFPSVAAARAVQGTAAIEALIAEFDRVWQGRVSRTREVFEVVDERA